METQVRVLIQCCVEACYHRRSDFRLAAQIFECLRQDGVDCHFTLSTEPDVSQCDLVHVFAGSDWPWAAWQVASVSLQGKPVVLWPVEWPSAPPAADPGALEGEALIEQGKALAAQAAMSLASAIIAASESQRSGLVGSAWLDEEIGCPRVCVLEFPPSAGLLQELCREVTRTGPVPRERLHLGLAEVCDRLVEPGVAMMKRHHQDELARERAEKDDLYRRFQKATELPIVKQYLAFRRWMSRRG